MDSMQKIMSSSANLQKSLGVMNAHFSALQKFTQEYPNLQEAYRNATTLQRAENHLLAMQGISKSMLGLQSIVEQSSFRIANAIAEQHKPLIQNPVQDMVAKIAGQTDTANAIAEQRKLSSDLLKDMFRKTALYSSLGCVVDLVEGQHSLKRDFTLQALIRDSVFLSQIANQSPFISAVQAQMPKMTKIWGTENVLAKIATASPVLESVFPIAIASINFSSELDRLKLQEQQRIVNVIEQIALDDETEPVISEQFDAETKKEYITLVDLLRDFWKKNKNQLLGILTTVETSVKNFSENDLSNPFTILAFIYNCLALLLNQLNTLNKEGADDNEDDTHKD